MEVSHNPYARIDRIEEEEEEVVSSEENENTTELPQKENQNQKMPVIIYKGVRPPVSVYQKPSDNFDKAHIVHENSKNQGLVFLFNFIFSNILRNTRFINFNINY